MRTSPAVGTRYTGRAQQLPSSKRIPELNERIETEYGAHFPSVRSRRSAHHTARKTSRHEREPDEQEQPRAPHRTGIPKVLMSLHAVLVDEVDYIHSQEGTDAG